MILIQADNNVNTWWDYGVLMALADYYMGNTQTFLTTQEFEAHLDGLVDP